MSDLKELKDVLLSAVKIIDEIDKSHDKWTIRHPGEGYDIECPSFEWAMDKWFEGFNVPYKVINGKLESTDSARKRVSEYFDNRKSI